MGDGLQIEYAVLDVDEHEVVPGALGNPRDLAGPAEAHQHAECGLAGSHPVEHRVAQVWSGLCGQVGFLLRFVHDVGLTSTSLHAAQLGPLHSQVSP